MGRDRDEQRLHEDARPINQGMPRTTDKLLKTRRDKKILFLRALEEILG